MMKNFRLLNKSNISSLKSFENLVVVHIVRCLLVKNKSCVKTKIELC